MFYKNINQLLIQKLFVVKIIIVFSGQGPETLTMTGKNSVMPT